MHICLGHFYRGMVEQWNINIQTQGMAGNPEAGGFVNRAVKSTIHKAAGRNNVQRPFSHSRPKGHFFRSTGIVPVKALERVGTATNP